MVKKNKSTNTRLCCPQKYFTNSRSFYSCIHCRTHLADHDELISRSFRGSYSRAYLFNSLINVSLGPAVQRELNTGPHAVADLFCRVCKTMVGWKYEKAFLDTQKYKEGKYIIEISHVVRENKHLEFDQSERVLKHEICPTFANAYLSSSSSSNIEDKSVCSNSYSQSSDSMPISSLASSIDVSNYNVTNSTCKQQSAKTAKVNNDKNFYDLNSPIYDELHTKLLVYPGSLSESYNKRMQDILYSNSKPYDWKNSNALEQTFKFEFSDGGSDASSNSISSSSGSSSRIDGSASSSSSSVNSSQLSCSPLQLTTSSTVLNVNANDESNLVKQPCSSSQNKFNKASGSTNKSSCLKETEETQFDLEDGDSLSDENKIKNDKALLESLNQRQAISNDDNKSCASLSDEEYFDCTSDNNFN